MKKNDVKRTFTSSDIAAEEKKKHVQTNGTETTEPNS